MKNKKFIILYKYFLVNREKITEETLSEIETLYTSFIDSIPHEGLKKEAEKFSELFGSKETNEGLKAFVEKRKANFR